MLQAVGIDYENPRLVRGLDYYNPVGGSMGHH